MKIEIWSDFVCPFCYIGKANLLQAIQELNLSDVKMVWRSFELDSAYPSSGPHHHFEVLQQKYAVDLTAAQAKCAQLSEIGSSCGLTMDFEQAYYGNTFLAHQLQQYASSISDEAAAAMNEALFKAVFAEGIDINQLDHLIHIAEEVGLDGAQSREVLNSLRFADAARSDEAAAAALNVTGVPFFGFDGRLAVAGAQSIDAFKEVIQHIAQHDAASDAGFARQ